MWAYEKDVRESIEASRTNALFLPEQKIPDCVLVTGNLAEALSGAEIVVSAMPSQHCRRLFQEMCSHLDPEMLLVSATKGLEQATLLRMTEVICQVTKQNGIDCRVGALSGPTFAAEVARGAPPAIPVPQKHRALRTKVRHEFRDPAFP